LNAFLQPVQIIISSISASETQHTSLRSFFVRQLEAHPGTVELRVSVTLDALPGLAVIEYEMVGHGGVALAGGAL